MIVLQLSKVDTSTFSCDSTRSASNSKPELSWVPTIKILIKVHSLTSSIFERLYLKEILVEDNFQLFIQKRFKMRPSRQ